MKKDITPYRDINEILLFISHNIQNILNNNLVGLYLFGSLTYGDFNPESSDIDLVAIVKNPLDQHELQLIKKFHQKLAEQNQKWHTRLEYSYTPISMLNSILPPKEPRPYFNSGSFYEAAPYGNEWIINNYLLYEYGIPLIGEDFKTLTNPINIIEVQKACIRDLFQEWELKMTDVEWLNNSHYQSYLVLNLCRILFTVSCGSTGSKKTSAEWVKNKFGLPWSILIETALSWKYGEKMSLQDETIAFLKFVIDKIKQTSLYKDMDSKIAD